MSMEKISSFDTLNFEVLVLFGMLGFILLVCIMILIIVWMTYRMHNVKNEKGEYAWMFPSAWVELPKVITESQEKIAHSLAELSEHNAKNAQLQQSMINILVRLHEKDRTEDGQTQRVKD